MSSVITVIKVWSQLNTSTSQHSPQLLQALLAAYAEPQRKYHNIDHIAAMLRLLQEAGITDPAAYWATLYHDAVYLPGARNNEKLSAVMAKSAMTLLYIEPNISALAVRIILATKKHVLSECPITQAVLDADMAIMGADVATYQQYRIAIRGEFSRVPAVLFKIGRVNFLDKLLKLPQIFGNDWFYEKFENSARLNIAGELAEFAKKQKLI